MIKKWFLSRSITFWTNLFLVVSLFLPSVKIYFIWSVFYVIWVFRLTRSWQKTVVYVFWPLGVYAVGQLYVFRIIQPEELKHPFYPDGRSLYFKLTPSLVLGLSMLACWLLRMINVRFRLKNYILILLLMLIVLFAQVSLLTNVLILPAAVYAANMARQLSIVVWLWWVVDFLNINADQKEKMFFWKYFADVLKAVLIIGSILIIVQGVKGSPVGLLVEQTSILPYYGSGSDEISLVSRPVGSYSHANIAAYYLLMGLEAWLMIWVFILEGRDRGREILSQKWLLIVGVALVWLQSRSVFLAGFTLLFWWVYFYFNQIKNKIKIVYIEGWRLVVLLFVLVFSTTVLTNRFWSSVMNVGAGSGWNTRMQSVAVATSLVERHFWFGVGAGNYIPIAYREEIGSAIREFPESVHNGWLLLMSESGVVGFTGWLLFLWLVLMRVKRNIQDKKFEYFIFCFLLSQSIVMMFQPISDLLTINVLLVVILLLTRYENNRE